MHFNRIHLTTLLVAFLAVVQVSAQIRVACGTVEDPYQLTRLRANVDAIAQQPILMRSVAPKYVPLHFIIVGNDSGDGYARFEQILEQVASLNALYAPQEMTFYIHDITYEANSNIYNNPAETISTFRMNQIDDENALNIFVTQSAENDSESPGVTLGYYSGQFDWIVIRKSELNGLNGTLGHEIGHFFSLAHPHRGWECEPYDEEMHGNPVMTFWSPCNGQLRIEYQDGSNCTFSGDFICDTPPDYNFGFGWSVGGDQCAEFTEEIMDPVGTVVDPMENNIMGYFLDCDNYAFTPMQMEVVEEDFLSPQRSYLRTGYIPVLDPVEDEVIYNFPINDEQSPSFNNIELDWADVDGATQYLVIVDRIATFTLVPERYIVEASNLVIDELNPGLRYYWKVWPYNESQTGAGYSAVQQFIAGMSSNVNEIPQVQAFNVYPNPVTEGQVLLTIDATSVFDAELQMVDVAGRILSSTTETGIGTSPVWSREINVGGYVPGVYFIRLISKDGVLVSKVSVQ